MVCVLTSQWLFVECVINKMRRHVRVADRCIIALRFVDIIQLSFLEQIFQPRNLVLKGTNVNERENA